VDGRSSSLGEARKTLGLNPLAALAATDSEGRLRPAVMELERPTLLQREQDFAFLRRWLAGAAPMAVLYGSRGMGKTALGWTFAEKVPKSLWVDLPEGNGLSGLAASVAAATGGRPPSAIDPAPVGSRRGARRRSGPSGARPGGALCRWRTDPKPPRHSPPSLARPRRHRATRSVPIGASSAASSVCSGSGTVTELSPSPESFTV